jgi:aminocarboxymuconate-semialdehyde decarboxylase
VPAAIKEMERAVGDLGLNGIMIADNVNGKMYDEPEFLPFFQAAEEAGAVILFHQLGGSSSVKDLNPRYHLSNTVGNPLDRTMTFASLVFGGVMDACPDLKVVLAHGGGYVCHGIGRMDHGWKVRPEAREKLLQPPSRYLRRFYYDSLTHSEAALRYLIDTVGVDRVVLGTDWPADMMTDWPVSWILSLSTLTEEEKELILHKNLEQLLGMKVQGR